MYIFDKVLEIQMLTVQKPKFNKGNVPYELHFTSHSKVTVHGKHTMENNRQRPTMKEIPGMSGDIGNSKNTCTSTAPERYKIISLNVNLANCKISLEIEGYLLNVFSATKNNNEWIGTITDGEFKLDVTSTSKPDSTLERGSKLKLLGYLETTG